MSLYLLKEAGALRSSPLMSPGLPWRLPMRNAPPPMQPPPTMTTVSRSAPPPPSPWPASARRPGVNEAGAIPYAIPGEYYDSTTPIGVQNLPTPAPRNFLTPAALQNVNAFASHAPPSAFVLDAPAAATQATLARLRALRGTAKGAGAIPYAIPWQNMPGAQTTPIGAQNLPAAPTLQQQLHTFFQTNPKEQAFVQAITKAMATHSAPVAPPLVLTPKQQANLAAIKAGMAGDRAALGARGFAGALIPQPMAMNVRALHAGKGTRSRNGAWALAAQAGMLREAGATQVQIGTGTGTDLNTLISQYNSAVASYQATLSSIQANPASDSSTLATQQATLNAAAGAANTLASQINTIQAANVGEGGTAPAPPTIIQPPTLNITDAPASSSSSTTTATTSATTPIVTQTPTPPAVEPPPTSTTTTTPIATATPTTTPTTTTTPPTDHTALAVAAGGALLAFLYFGRNKRR